MWQKPTLHVGRVLLMMCALVSLAWAQLSPGEQAAQSGLPMLTEFTLRAGQPQPFVYQYKATTDGPHRMIAAWGTVVPLKMTLSTGVPDPVSQQGNPVTLTFTATNGVTYTLALQPVGNLPVTSVGEMFGGPDKAAPVLTQPLQPVTLSPTLQVLAPLPAKVPLAPQAQGAAAAVSRETAVGALMARPDTRQSLEQAGLAAGLQPMQLISTGLDKFPVPGGGKTAVVPPRGGNMLLQPANLPQSVDAFDWKSGVRVSPLVGGPYYQKANQAVPLARWFMVGMCDILADPLPTLLQKGLAPLHFGLPGGVPDTMVKLEVDLPQTAATYLVTLHLTDRTGRSMAAWTQPTDPAEPKSRRLLVGTASCAAAGSLTPLLAPLAGEQGGYATLIFIPAGVGSETFEFTSLVGWKGGWSMGGPGVWGWPQAVGPDEPLAPALFGGVTIMRL